VQHLQVELASMARKVQASQAGLHDYIGAITSAQEEERLRLARELHDDTIQELIVLKQRVQLARKASKDQETAPLLAELERLAEGTIANVRRMTRDLRPIYLEDLGLVTALEMLTRETSQPDQLQVHFERTGRERRLSREAELALYRIAQQALNNVVRHAQARRASLKVDFAEAEIRLEVSDDGSANAPATDLPSGTSACLACATRRPDRSTPEVHSQPGRGTRISALSRNRRTKQRADSRI
jgi:signal transduction histidine kinase